MVCTNDGFGGIDGRRLPGVWLTAHAIDTAVPRARQYGTATVVVRRSHHIACLGAFLSRATRHGLMILIASSDPSVSSVAPFGGRTPVFTPDPFAVGIPTSEEPILIDTSASITTNGMSARLRAEGRRFPHAWLLDATGEPSDDPNVLFEEPAGTILPKPTGPVGDSRVALGASVAGAEGSAAITEEITAALHTTEWPTLVPAIDDLDDAKNDEFAAGSSCLNPASLTDKTLCTYGDGGQLVVVVGDSFAIAWMPAIRQALEPLGYSVRGIGVSTCPFSTTDVDLDLGATATDRCNSSQQARVDLVNSLDPDVVLILDSEYSYSQTVVGGQENRAESWVRGRTDVLSQIEAPGRQVAILAPNPGGLRLTECATTNSVPAECTSTVDPAWFSKNQADADAASISHVTYISTLEWFCEDNICPAFVGATPVRWDSGHLTEQYAKTLAEPLRDVLRKLAVVTG